MAHTTFNELSQNFQCVLREAVDMTREIGDLSKTIVTKLQRPLEDTSGHMQCLVKETLTLLSTINQKVRTVQEILKSKVPRDFLDTKVLNTDKPHVNRPDPIEAEALFPPTSSVSKLQTNLFNDILPKLPIHNTSLSNLLPQNNSNTRHIKKGSQHVKDSPFHGNHGNRRGYGTSRPFTAPRMGTSDWDQGGIIEQVMKMCTEEFAPDFVRRLSSMDIPAGDVNDQMLDFNRFLSQLMEDIEEANQYRSLQLQGTTSLDTILCLDTSNSMCGENFQKMIIAANNIVDGFAALATHKELRGNIAVTTFGAEPSVAIHLTSDYSKARNVIGSIVAEGPSPLYRGLSLSMAVCTSSLVSMSNTNLMARIIVFTDGKFSLEDAREENVQHDPKNDIMVKSAAKMMKMHGVVCNCVLIGASPESLLLKALTETTKGRIYRDEFVEDLIEMPTQLETFATPAVNISKLSSPNVVGREEYLVKELELLELPPVGTRVRRGPDWNPGDNQDSDGPGTVVCHNKSGSIAVLWDSGVKPIPYRCDEPCQVLPTDNDDRTVTPDGWIQVGCKVMRGPGWTRGDDDGGQGSVGVVCLCTRNGTVKVRWPSTIIGEYRYGDEVVLPYASEGYVAGPGCNKNTREMETENIGKPKEYGKICVSHTRDSNLKQLKQRKFEDPVKAEPDGNTQTVPANSETVRFTPNVWSYLQEGQVEWTPFDTSNNVKLETDWSKQRKTTMVSANSKRFRVVFEKMTMSSIGSTTECKQLKLQVKRERKSTEDEDTEHLYSPPR